MKILGMMLLLVAVAGAAFGAVPEIDASTGANTVALLGGAYLLIRARRRR